MLFAAGVSVLADVFAYPSRFSVMFLIPRQNQGTPVMEVRGIEPLSEM